MLSSIKNNLISLFTILILAILFFIAIEAVNFAKNTTRQVSTLNSPEPSPTLDTQQILNQKLLLAVERAKTILQASPDLDSHNKSKLQIALAIYNTKDDTISEYRYWLNKDSEKYTGKVELVPVDDSFPSVAITNWNGYNSTYEPDNSDLVVVGNKYPVRSNTLGTLPEHTQNQYSDIIYVPISPALINPVSVAEGNKYLDAIIRSAYKDMDDRNVTSKEDPQVRITKQIPFELIKSIILIEHIDPSAFDSAPDGGRALVNRVLAIIGTNKNLAYRYSSSPAGASGISQFIRPTYISMTELYPEAHLITDFNVGTADHINAAKSMICFFDAHIVKIREFINNKVDNKPVQLTEEMLAAAYNGGPSRVSKSLVEHGMSWIYSQLDPNSKKIFRQETIDYVRKYSAVRNILQDTENRYHN